MTELAAVTRYLELRAMLHARGRTPTIERLAALAHGLGLQLVVVEDPEALARIEATSEPRDESRTHHSGVVSLQFSRRHMRRIGKKGGQNSRKYMSARERRRLARKAGLARWHKPTVREVAV